LSYAWESGSNYAGRPRGVNAASADRNAPEKSGRRGATVCLLAAEQTNALSNHRRRHVPQPPPRASSVADTSVVSRVRALQRQHSQ